MPIVMENQTSPEPTSPTNESENTAQFNGKTSRSDKDGLCPYHHNVNKTPDGIDTGHIMSSNLTSGINHEHLNNSSVLNETLMNESRADVVKNGTESPPLNKMLHNELDSNECSHKSSIRNGHEPVVTEKETESVEETCPLKQNEHESIKNEAQSVDTESETSDISKKENNDNKEEFATFSLKLILPSVPEPIDIVHIAKDTVNDLLQYAFERPETCYRTCLSVRMNGKRLDNFAELGSIKGLKNKSVLELAEEPYSLRDVIVHIQRFQELLGSNPLQQSLSCNNGLSLSFLSLIANNLEDNATINRQLDQDIPSPPEYLSPEESSVSLPLVPFYPPLLEQTNQIPECLKQLAYSSWNPPLPNRKLKGDIAYLDMKTLEGEEYCVTACPTGFYLNRTVPGGSFDPSPRKIAHHCQHLITLLQQISPLFRKNYSLLQKYGEKKHAFEVFPVPYPVYPWVVPKLEAKPLIFRIDDTMGLKASTDELLVGQLRDWNEELQTTRELPMASLQHRVFRDRALFKIHSDFIQAAVRGAKAAIDGQLHPLNPADPDKHHMFLWNNIFFSTGFDGRGHFKDFGGDEAGHAAANYDLQGVGIVERLNIEGLHTLGAVLIDYRGYHVFAQSIVPGLLQREHESSIVYGSMDNGKTIIMNDKFQELMRSCAKELHLREHKVLTEVNEEVELPVSLEVKGIQGTDGRHYILDLFRILPPDANYVDIGGDKASAQTNGIRHKLYILRPELVDGFVRTTRRLALELHMFQEMQKSLSHNKEKSKTENEDKVEDSNPEEKVKDNNSEDKVKEDAIATISEDNEKTMEHRHMALEESPSSSSTSPLSNLPLSSLPDCPVVMLLTDDVVGETDSKELDNSDLTNLLMLESLDLEKQCGPEIAGDEEILSSTVNSALNLNDVTLEPSQDKTGAKDDTTTLLPQPPKELTDIQTFDVQFNADIYAPNVRHADSTEELEKDRKLVHDVAGFLTNTIIPKFVRDCVYLNISPLDGSSLKMQLHARGINLRYLGKIATLSANRNDLDHLFRLCINEMILRTARRKLRKVLLNTPLHRTAAAIAHVLNCFLTDIEDGQSDESGGAKKKSKRKRGGKEAVVKVTSSGKDSSFTGLTQSKLWKLIQEDVSLHYRFELDFTSVTQVCSQYDINKVTLLREFCLKTGIQILLKDYKYSSLTPFHEDDITSLVPVVKHTDFRPTEAAGLYELAQLRLQSGNIKIAHNYLMEAVQLFAQVYGPIHVDIANCYRVIARIHHALGEHSLAISYQHKTALMFERLLGVDNFNTVLAYFHLGQYCYAGGRTDPALQLLYRVRYLILLVHGQDHPEMANVDFYIGLILGNCGDHSNSLKFLSHTLNLQSKYHGTSSITVATTHHLIANALTHLGSFSDAKQHEKKAYDIYKNKLGPDHARTKESYKDVRYITEKHVTYDQTVQLAQGLSGGVMSVVESDQKKSQTSKSNASRRKPKILNSTTKT